MTDKQKTITELWWESLDRMEKTQASILKAQKELLDRYAETNKVIQTMANCLANISECLTEIAGKEENPSGFNTSLKENNERVMRWIGSQEQEFKRYKAWEAKQNGKSTG